MLLKESKRVLLGIPFLIFVVVMVIDVFTQYGNTLSERIEEPLPGLENYSDYGFTSSGNEEQIMQKSITSLITEFKENTYTSYPIGFYKEVKLNDKKRSEVGEILEKLTGYTPDDIVKTIFSIPYTTINESGEMVEVVPQEGADIPVVSEQVSYKEFEQLMERVDRLIGGGSSYDSRGLEMSGRRPRTYDEAMEVYQQLKSEGFAPACARLLCDYLTLFASLFPAFIAVAVWMQDRGAKTRDVLWTKPVSAIRLTLTRYAAIVIACTAVILLLTAFAAFNVSGNYGGEASNVNMFFKYALIWVVPSIMISTAIGAFFTELTDTPIGILVMGVYWFASINTTSLTGKELLTLAPRHNDMFELAGFEASYQTLLSNRALFAALSIIIILVTAFVLERKRRGRWLRIDKITIRRKKKSVS